MEKLIRLLDKGEIELIDALGNDLTVVNAARVSFGQRKDVWDDSDERLVRYLAQNEHTSPFRHIMVQFRIKAPEFVMRQLYKHVVGIETTSTYSTKDHAWNEISGRYTKVDEFYVPNTWRYQSTNNKQASEGSLDGLSAKIATQRYEELLGEIDRVYHNLLDLGIAKEQARILLPISQYTEVYWTASFQAIMNFIELRDHVHAQYEIRVYAEAMKKMMLELFPKVTNLWFDNRGK